MTKNKKLYYNIVLIMLGCFAAFLHLYRLTSLPEALNVDEAGLWYNVKCLLNWGVDQKGNSWPILFANMWGEQSPAYAYLAFICCKIFGESLFAIRLPAVINTFLVLIFGFKTVDILFKNKKLNLLFVFLYTITPYFTMISKMALDCNLMLGFSTMFLYFFFRALETRSLKWYFVTGVVVGLTFYTYALSYLMIPLFLIFALIYLICYKRVTIKEIAAFCVPAVLLGLPLLMVQLINILGWQEIQFCGITFTRFESVRNGEFVLSVSNIVFNVICSVIYVFKGFKNSIYNIPCGYLLYPTSILVILGSVFAIRDFLISVKNKEFQPQNILLCWVFAILFTTAMLNAGRDLYQQCAIYFAYLIFAIYAILAFFEMLKSARAKKAFIIILAIIYLAFFIWWGWFYFTEYDEFVSETKLMADVVPEKLHELDGTTYFLKHYVYYQATYCVSPSDFKADDSEPFKYRNIIFNFYLLEDTPIDENCNYVIYYKDFEKIGFLAEYNFDVERVGNYLFYAPAT